MVKLMRRMSTDPVPVVRQSRPIPVRVATTMKPGKFVPIAAIPLLREDGVQGSIPFACDMRETYEFLLNKTFLRVTSVFVSHLAHERFEKNPTFFQKSYQGEIPMAGKPVIPFIRTAAFTATPANDEIAMSLGLIAKAGALYNTAYHESYILSWNFLARSRSKDITAKLLTSTTLGPAFWGENNMSEIVPDFDDALIAGEVPLTLVAGRLGVRTSTPAGNDVTVIQDPSAQRRNLTSDLASVRLGGLAGTAANDLYVEMQQQGLKVSLANLEQARKLVSWAKLREAFEGHTDEWIIDTLMQGFHIEDQEFMQPIVLDQVTVQFRQALRYSTDHDNMDAKATNGVASGSINIHVPPNMYGGVVMIFAEVVPEQLFERQPDPYFTALTVDDFPNYMQDALDPMPVEKVLNKHVDAMHATPDGLFGYARKNWRWLKWPFRVGGDMWSAVTGTVTTEARREIWPTDVANPKLAEEFYLSTTLGVTPFLDTTRQQFKMALNGVAAITGLTIIGAVHESEANYDAVRDQTPALIPGKPA